MNTKTALIDYYQKSRPLYKLIMGGSQHFGFYPGGKQISEEQAQIEYHRKLATTLAAKKGDILLDAGCGAGIAATYLASERKCEVQGVTLVPHEVEEAKQRATEMRMTDRTNFQIMDYNALKFPDDTFDAIYTTETLSHSPDLGKTMEEFFRVLHPGGRVVFFEYSLAPDEAFSEHELALVKRVAQGSAMHGLTCFRHEEFPAFLASHGFIDTKETNITNNMLPSLERLKKISHIVYSIIVKPFGIQHRYPNVSAPSVMLPLIEKDLVRYNIYTATKPASNDN